MKAAKLSVPTTSPTPTPVTQPFFAPVRTETEHKAVSTFFPPFVQTKLSVGKADDPYEREADAVADHIAAKSSSPLAATPGPMRKEGSNQKIRRKPLENADAPRISKIKEEEKKDLRKKEAGGSTQMPGDIFEARLVASQTGGEPLQADLLAFMQTNFKRDFSKIKVHKDAFANEMSAEMGAKAFAFNNHIYFRAGTYNPESFIGIHLLAHELAHVVQQGVTETLEPPAPETVFSVDTPAPVPPIKPEKPEKKPPSPKRKAKSRLEKERPPKAGAGKTDENAAEGSDGKPKGSPKSPEDDPAFQAMTKKSKTQAKKTKKHDPAEKKVGEAQSAVVLPANEINSKAKSKQVEKLAEQKPKKFNAEAFKAVLMDKIEKAAPKNLEEANNFKKKNRVAEVKTAVSGKVGEEKDAASQDIQETNTEAPSTEGITARPAQALPPANPGAPPPGIGAQKAVPPKRTPDEVSLQAGSDSLDQQMKDGAVTEDQLKEGNEPSFNQAVSAKGTAQKDAQTAPVAYRGEEKGMLQKAEGDFQKSAGQDLREMHGARTEEFGAVATQQNTAKTDEEKAREQIAKDLEAIYAATKKTVDDRLALLTTTVATMFDNGATAAQKLFEDYVGMKMSAYKAKRYSGWTGGLKWAKDKLFGMPDSVNQFYVDGRHIYLDAMDRAITDIANHVATELNAATADVAAGKQKVQDYFNSLDADKKRIAGDTLSEVMGRFDMLESSVEDKQNELVDTLAQKYKDNLEKLDARIEEMKAANKGLVDKAIGFVKGVIKAIKQLGELLFDVLRKIVQVVGYILKHPIQFLKNFFKGVTQGLKSFIGNITKHLKEGFMRWLTGSGGISIKMPAQLNAEGILFMILQFLELTPEGILARAAARIPAAIWKQIENVFDIFLILKKDGLAGLWKYIRDKLESMAGAAYDAVLDFLKTKVMDAGINFVLGLLTPAGAFIKACQAIYKIVKFIFEKGKQIIQFINAVLDSMLDIAAGNVSGAAAKVENSLVQAIPLAIGFLAGILNLDDIPKKVQDIFKRIKAPVDNAINWIIDKAIAFGKGLVAGGKAVVGKVLGWWTKKKHFKAADNSDHDLYFKGDDKNASIIVASAVPMPVKDFLTKIKTDADKASLNEQWKSANTLFKSIEVLINKIETSVPPRQAADIDKLNLALESLTTVIAPLIPLLFSAGSTTPIGNVPVKVGDFVRGLLLDKRTLRAVISDINMSSQKISYRLIANTVAHETETLSISFFNELFTKGKISTFEFDPRDIYMGATPDRSSPTGILVQKRMEIEGKIVNGKVQDRAGSWVSIADCDMGHVIDAVTWWNSNGRLTGARSSAVIKFMQNPSNYELEPSSQNRSRGASLSARGVRYLPPLV